MRRFRRLSLAACAALVLAACGADKSTNPAAPTPSPSPTPVPNATVSSIAVTGAPGATSTTFQLTATASLSNGTTQDVTRTAAWESSNTHIATVSSAGLVTIVDSGEVDLRATYQGVSGSIHQTVNLPKPATHSVTGTVTEVAPNLRPVVNARVQVIGGDHTFTDDRGAFTMPGIPGGRTVIEVSKDGYNTWENELTLSGDTQVAVSLYPTPPKNADGATATARCNDGSWSWAQTKSDACTANGGIAYTVCPGPLCSTP